MCVCMYVCVCVRETRLMVDYTGNIHSVMLIEGYFARLSACVYVCLSVCVCVCMCVYM